MNGAYDEEHVNGCWQFEKTMFNAVKLIECVRLNRTSNKTDIGGYAGKLKTMVPCWTEIHFISIHLMMN